MITVGVCAYNEEKSIGKSVGALLKQLGRTDELIVVASGCTDKTAEIVRQIAKQDKHVKVIEELKRKGKTSAMNKILVQARGGKIVFCDADVLPGEKAVERLAEAVRGKVAAANARTVPVKVENFYEKMQEIAWAILHDQRLRLSKRGKLFPLNGFLFAVKKGIVKRLPEDCLIDDKIFGWMIKRKGFFIGYVPEAIVYVKPAQNFADFFGQKLRNRVGQVRQAKYCREKAYDLKAGDILQLLSLPGIALALIDVTVWLCAGIYFLFGKLEWPQIKSTKM